MQTVKEDMPLQSSTAHMYLYIYIYKYLHKSGDIHPHCILQFHIISSSLLVSMFSFSYSFCSSLQNNDAWTDKTVSITSENIEWHNQEHSIVLNSEKWENKTDKA